MSRKLWKEARRHAKTIARDMDRTARLARKVPRWRVSPGRCRIQGLLPPMAGTVGGAAQKGTGEVAEEDDALHRGGVAGGRARQEDAEGAAAVAKGSDGETT